jgi:hypothetical protein
VNSNQSGLIDFSGVQQQYHRIRDSRNESREAAFQQTQK